MERFRPTVADLLADYWQRYPARHDVRVLVDGCVVSIYANSEPLVAHLQRAYHDQLTIARPEILVAVIDDPSLRPSFSVLEGSTSFAITVEDGRIAWLAGERLLQISGRGRYMLGGDCASRPQQIRRFVQDSVDDWMASGAGRLRRQAHAR